VKLNSNSDAIPFYVGTIGLGFCGKWSKEIQN